jgi:hypothetical protein
MLPDVLTQESPKPYKNLKMIANTMKRVLKRKYELFDIILLVLRYEA